VRDEVFARAARGSGRSSNRNRDLSPSVNTSRLTETNQCARIRDGWAER